MNEKTRNGTLLVLWLLISMATAIAASVIAVKLDRIWAESSLELEGCRHWCYLTTPKSSNSTERYLRCYKECRETVR